MITKSSRKRVEELPGGSIRVYLNSPPVGGKANEELIEAVAKHLGVPRGTISIVRGEKSRNKLLKVEIPD